MNEINIQFKQQINNIKLILSGSEERLSVFDEKRNESFLLVGLQQFLAQVTWPARPKNHRSKTHAQIFNTHFVRLFAHWNPEILRLNLNVFYHCKLLNFNKLHRNYLPRWAIRNSRVEKWAGWSRLSAKWIIPRVIFKSDSAEERIFK